MAGIFIYEFLFRGREPDAPVPPAWHLTLGATETDAFGEKRTTYRTLNMEQAAELGYGLPEIIGEINTEVLRELDAERAARAEDAGRDANEIGRLTIALDQAKADAKANADALSAASAAAAERLAEVNRENGALQERIRQITDAMTVQAADLQAAREAASQAAALDLSMDTGAERSPQHVAS